MSYLAAVLGYLVVVGAVALWRWREVPSAEDFTLAGRQLPARMLMPTLLVTWISAGTLFGAAGLAYRVEFPAMWIAVGGWIGIVVLIAIAPRIRAAGGDTLPEILGARFGAIAQMVAVIALVLAYVTIVAYQFRGGGRLLQLAIGMDPRMGAAIFAMFCLFYAALAGLRSIAWTDIVNAGALVAGIGMTSLFVSGGFQSGNAAVATSHAHRIVVFGPISPFAAIGLLVPTLVLLLSEASVYQKAAAAKSDRAFRTSLVMWLVATFAIEFLLVGIAVEGRHLLPGLRDEQSEEIIVRLATGVLPYAIALPLLCAATAILVSTATTCLLTASTAVVRQVSRPGRVSDPGVVMRLRTVIVALALAAFVLGNVYPGSLHVALRIYGMYGAAVTPALLAALLWPRVPREAALASMAVGVAATVVWEAAGLTAAGYPLGLEALLPAVMASSATLAAITAILSRR